MIQEVERIKRSVRKGKIFTLFSCLQLALSEKLFDNDKSDIYQIASEYGKGIEKSDYDLIKNMTVDEIIKELIL